MQIKLKDILVKYANSRGGGMPLTAQEICNAVVMWTQDYLHNNVGGGTKLYKHKIKYNFYNDGNFTSPLTFGTFTVLSTRAEPYDNITNILNDGIPYFYTGQFIQIGGAINDNVTLFGVSGAPYTNQRRFNGTGIKWSNSQMVTIYSEIASDEVTEL